MTLCYGCQGANLSVKCFMKHSDAVFTLPFYDNDYIIIRRIAVLYYGQQAYRHRSKNMITYEKLWTTMKEKGVSQYCLIKDHKISSGQLDRLRRNENVTTYVLNKLCRILDCRIEDIIEYRNDAGPGEA